MNRLLHGHSGTAPETSRNALSASQGTNEDDSQSDPHPVAGLFHNQMTQNSGPEDGQDIILQYQSSIGDSIEKRENRKKIRFLLCRHNFPVLCMGMLYYVELVEFFDLVYYADIIGIFNLAENAEVYM